MSADDRPESQTVTAMAVTQDEDERRTRKDEMLRRLRHQADVSQEERRVVSESLAERAQNCENSATEARIRADQITVASINRTRRKAR